MTRQTTLLGYSTWPAHRILRHVDDGHDIGAIPGDFTLIARGTSPAGECDDIIVTSAAATRPYYIYRGTTPAHGRNIFRLVSDAHLPWKWNERAIRSMALLGHTIDKDTLHRDVERIPPCTCTRIRARSVSNVGGPFWNECFTGPDSGDGSAVGCFNTVCDEFVSDTSRPLVSLSGGFDSRAILARCLQNGAGATLLTMGSAESTDRIVASAIAKGIGLEHHVVEVNPEAYLEHAASITNLTGGTKTAANWHTYIYSLETRSLGSPHIVGANGEFARSYYLDKGLPARCFGHAAVGGTFAYFLARVEKRRRASSGFLSCLDITPRDTLSFVGRLTKLAGSGDSLNALDRFYATQRLRHFIGSGLELYNANGLTVSPFVDARLIRAIGRLPRRMKQGSNFHRELILSNYPRLAEFPIHGKAKMAPNSGPLGWIHGHPPEQGYSPYKRVISDPVVHELIIESPYLDDVTSRTERERAVVQKNPVVLDLLLTLHFAATAASGPVQ